MTVLHFLSCVGITYAPIYIAYKSTRIGEFKSFSPVLFGAAGYFVTQLAKMMLLATFLPSFDTSIYSVYQEVIRLFNGVVDLFAIFVLLHLSHAPKDVRALGIGLGWALADALPRVYSLWGAMPLEFDSMHLINSFESNVATLHSVAICYVVASLTRKQKKSGNNSNNSGSNMLTDFLSILRTPSMALLSLIIYLTVPLVHSYLNLVVGANAFVLLAVNIAMVLANSLLIVSGPLKSELASSSSPTMARQ
ncbi:hypothetical protein SAMD00019534_028580 [Acytostelium subglobosum LB1]|uniref:hypothetical protein n=1 Tax=Acytostelium subglobosum LB1 TaxID=1410327 RepID=UPI000645134B|nr:hypothetical protein SAMD00019534_028580 [Acytostelium subglobosum LB1]GAM19683.1 hypothetical protein SAMD00019534_028580 [Acytostelium subglobosum LB1]|eukprot:XP_012756445.1 hypothetical protein SAMD00019534_028580 [Acytostelium subglobosum LB1]